MLKKASIMSEKMKKNQNAFFNGKINALESGQKGFKIVTAAVRNLFQLFSLEC